ncbi:MAG: tetratricopeptide repeat protein [Proteobacteria bacterium]|nr:tetratricopeptide repeat protein [Pseudomonadota bacterium]
MPAAPSAGSPAPSLAGAMTRAAQLHRAGRLAEAITVYRRVIKAAPKTAQAHNNLAAALSAAGRPREALASYRRAVRLRPGYAIAQSNLGALLVGLGKTEEGLEHLAGAYLHGDNQAEGGGGPVARDRLLANLAPLAPPGALLVSESGIATRQDVIALGKHVGAFLIGSALMQSKARDLLVRRLVFGEVKICGITRKSDAHDAYKCGATYGGLNFVAGTPRAIPPSRARKIKAGIPLSWIGVFRGRAPEYAADIAAQLDLSGVQLHGRETPAYRARLRSLLPEGCEIWQALALDGGPAPRTLPHADRLLFDTRTASQFGGTGQAFDWAYLNQTKMPSGYGLAGGIHAGNVLAALAAGAPLIDICSGVEAAPGVKSLKKMKDLFQTIRKFKDGAAEQRPC